MLCVKKYLNVFCQCILAFKEITLTLTVKGQ